MIFFLVHLPRNCLDFTALLLPFSLSAKILLLTWVREVQTTFCFDQASVWILTNVCHLLMTYSQGIAVILFFPFLFVRLLLYANDSLSSSQCSSYIFPFASTLQFSLQFSFVSLTLLTVFALHASRILWHGLLIWARLDLENLLSWCLTFHFIQQSCRLQLNVFFQIPLLSFDNLQASFLLRCLEFRHILIRPLLSKILSQLFFPQ